MNFDYDDIVQVGMLGLFKAMDKYDVHHEK